MKHFLLLLFVGLGLALSAQETFTPQKTRETEIVIDGVLSENEWSNAVKIPFDIEFSPANNQPARKETTAYVTYSDTHLFVGIFAKDDPKNIRASIRPRDDRSIWNDDVVLMRLDPFADARNNLGLAVNALGSQFDVKQVNALSDEDRYDSTFNVNFESKGSIIENGYNVEMKIPFSEIPFPNGKNQLWHINFYRRYIENGNEIEVSSQPRDRNNTCVVCQTTDRLVLKDILIDKRFELLPYVSSNIQAERTRPEDALSYGALKGDIGLGLNLD
ncbi:MAG: carbohydrate binding family 9 domain-containing protein, partial [Flavobacteriaceae bacterium]